MLGAEVDDRLAGSYSFMTMLSILTVAWLMARQNGLLDGDAAADLRPPFVAGKRAAARFFLDHLVPEAIGLKASAMTGSALLCGISDEALA